MLLFCEKNNKTKKQLNLQAQEYRELEDYKIYQYVSIDFSSQITGKVQVKHAHRHIGKKTTCLDTSTLLKTHGTRVLKEYWSKPLHSSYYTTAHH